MKFIIKAKFKHYIHPCYLSKTAGWDGRKQAMQFATTQAAQEFIARWNETWAENRTILSLEVVAA